MAIPTYDQFFPSVLKVLSDEKVHSAAEIRKMIVDELGFSKEEQEEVLPSGKQSKISNRIGWAKTYLIKAGLVKKVGFGKSKITDEGLKAYNSKEKIDLNYLERYSDFNDFAGVSDTQSVKSLDAEAMDTKSILTPDEILDDAVNKINEKLISDLQVKINGCDPFFFERLVVDLLERIYGGNFSENAEVTGKTGDEGIDGIIKQDRLGFNNIYIQAKQWSQNVDRTEVQKFAGALQGQGALNGAFITSADFSKSSREYVNKISASTHIVLINGRDLARLMVEYDVGVSDKCLIKIKKIDADYFNPDDE